MNYREKMREYIKSPTTGSAYGYGKWGALNIEQRNMIKKLLDEMDRADIQIRHLLEENIKLKEAIEKYKPYFQGIDFVEEINNNWEEMGQCFNEEQ